MKVWVISLLVAALIVTLFSNLQRIGLLPRNAEDFHSLNLARLQNVPASSLHVVAIGSSKTFRALEFDQQFAKRLNVSARVVAFTRISANAPGIAELDVALDALLQTPPDLLLVESDLLLVNRQFEPHAWAARIRSNLWLLGTRSRDTLLLSTALNYGEDDWPSSADCLAAKAPVRSQAYATASKRWTTASAADRAEYLVSLRALEMAGTQVVLLELPRSPSAEIAVPALFNQQTAQLRESLLDDERYLNWTPGTIAESLYCDQGHLNQQGRAFYSEWLATRLVAWLVHSNA